LFSGLNTTAGSFSLLKSIVPGDAGVVKRLRAAGAIILGMTPALLQNYYLTTILQGRLIYRNSPILEETSPMDGQEEAANARTPISPTLIPVDHLLDLELQHQSALSPLHWVRKRTEA
jgi:hypothetical protein